MQILVGLLIVGVIIALTRLWTTACEESPSEANPSPGSPAYVSASPTDSIGYDISGCSSDAGGTTGAGPN